MDYPRYLNYATLFDQFPKRFESWLIYKPSQLNAMRLEAAVDKPLFSANAMALRLPPAFSVMSLNQLGILMTANYGDLTLHTARYRQDSFKLQVRAGASRQFYLHPEDLTDMNRWLQRVGDDWFL